ncbi:hypothetical protein H0H87_007466 [Tephrocybe sp. NHM501043]|nr:hypothetical protein H0H87_007466 [Tephrocybe sp. NHM501043]
MIVSSAFTIGQVTFVLRVIVQILSYLGPILIGFILLGNIPRLAPIDTHDVVNRIMGASSVTPATCKWILRSIWRNITHPKPPSNLQIILTLSITYSAFVSLSDVGFLGFHVCPVPGPSTMEHPASLDSDDAARAFASSNMINGAELANITAWRCDSSSLIPATSFHNCTSWRNSTYSDPTLFTGINATDSDVLLIRQLRVESILQKSLSRVNMNGFYIGPDTQRLYTPTISNGLAINPHPTGVQIITGIPQLSSYQNVTIPQTMAIEVEVGCMSLGVTTSREMDSTVGVDFFVVDDSWQEYTGPEYLRDVLVQSAEETRTYLRSFFKESTLSSGKLSRSVRNNIYAVWSLAARVTPVILWTRRGGKSGEIDDLLNANCTAALRNHLAPSTSAIGTSAATPAHFLNMCGHFKVQGTMAVQGYSSIEIRRMICASVTQVNMVSASISFSASNQTSVTSMERLPSELNYIRADFPSAVYTTLNRSFLPYERYTLTPSSTGATSHFILHTLNADSMGPGSGASVISTFSRILIDPSRRLGSSVDYAALDLLPAGFTPLANFSTSLVTEWFGQVGGSVASASLTYNGWAARQIPPMLVTSFGGHIGSCYNPKYAVAFIPLVLVVTAVLVWIIVSRFRGSLIGSGRVEDAYTGLAPFSSAVSPDELEEDALLVWEHKGASRPYLRVVEEGQPITGDPSDTALRYFKAHTNSL